MEFNRMEIEGTFGFAILVLYLLSSMYFPLLKIRILHQTGAAVLLGILAGLIVTTFFFYFVLPPIIFTEGYTMRRKRFFQNISYISLFGVVGTLVTFVVNALGAYYISENDWIHDYKGNAINLTGQDVLLLAAILSASDSVAACSMIEEEDSPRINSILLGAGVMNDALSIILFHSASNLGVKSLHASDIAMFFLEFLDDLLASIAIGVCFGVLSAVMTKYVKKFEEYPSYETALLFFLAYIGYLLTEMLNFSGVISILCTGIVMGHYTWYNLSTEARIVSRAAFTIVGELLVAYIFVYVGFSTFSLYGDDISYDFIGLMILVLMSGRLLGIVVIPGILKLGLKRRFILKWKEVSAIWFAGCIRGAVAFALILSVDKSNEDSGIKRRNVLKTAVLGIVLFTTIVFGSIMPLLKTFILSLRTL